MTLLLRENKTPEPDRLRSYNKGFKRVSSWNRMKRTIRNPIHRAGEDHRQAQDRGHALHRNKDEHVFNMLARALEDPVLVSAVADNLHDLQKVPQLLSFRKTELPGG
ncbi:hypothetical protein llap_10256 [Limosa lapponica baueri]|uniref:Uncharacterized protein n=1 Tax=Limosa lapponica baueri TaxID=1758121 RepID=A0A2I0U040_LIMLA|nr:hypothetical protein llap_10256 [Limosa lapponica baueri]